MFNLFIAAKNDKGAKVTQAGKNIQNELTTCSGHLTGGFSGAEGEVGRQVQDSLKWENKCNLLQNGNHVLEVGPIT